MKTGFLILPGLAILLAACATSNTSNSNDSAEARDAREYRVGSYLPRKKGESADNVGTVDKQQIENMQRTGAGTTDSVIR